MVTDQLLLKHEHQNANIDCPTLLTQTNLVRGFRGTSSRIRKKKKTWCSLPYALSSNEHLLFTEASVFWNIANEVPEHIFRSPSILMEKRCNDFSFLIQRSQHTCWLCIPVRVCSARWQPGWVVGARLFFYEAHPTSQVSCPPSQLPKALGPSDSSKCHSELWTSGFRPLVGEKWGRRWKVKNSTM